MTIDDEERKKRSLKGARNKLAPGKDRSDACLQTLRGGKRQVTDDGALTPFLDVSVGVTGIMRR